MNQISRDRKKILVKLLCLLMIITAIQIPQREVYADEGQSITPTITRSYSGVVNKKIARTTIIEVGNTIEGKATITEVFDQQELIIGSVALNGVSVSNYKYTTNANGTNELSYTISEFNKYAATDKLKLTYETKVIDSVYEKDEATTLTNTSSLYDETGNVVVSTKGSILISPNSIKQNVVIDLKQKLATWTYEINGDEIAMYAPIFTWSVNDPYLKLVDNSLTIKDGEGINVTTSIADLNKWNFDGWVKNKDGYYSGHYGFDNTGNYKTLLNKKVIISFQTEITDDFYKENRIDYMFNVSASISWLPNAQGTDETRININSKENKKEKRASYEVIKKEAVEYNESTGSCYRQVV